MTEQRSFAEFIAVHRRLDGLFLDHQLALLVLDLARARAALQRYENELLVHIKDEEELLIPLYDHRTTNVPGGAVELFTGEHTKLKGFVAEFYRTLDELDGKPESELKRGVIGLFDREAVCKGLTEHHHAREESILFPWLNRVTSDDERARLLDQCSSLQAARSAIALA